MHKYKCPRSPVAVRQVRRHTAEPGAVPDLSQDLHGFLNGGSGLNGEWPEEDEVVPPLRLPSGEHTMAGKFEWLLDQQKNCILGAEQRIVERTEALTHTIDQRIIEAVTYALDQRLKGEELPCKTEGVPNTMGLRALASSPSIDRPGPRMSFSQSPDVKDLPQRAAVAPEDVAPKMAALAPIPGQNPVSRLSSLGSASSSFRSASKNNPEVCSAGVSAEDEEAQEDEEPSYPAFGRISSLDNNAEKTHLGDSTIMDEIKAHQPTPLQRNGSSEALGSLVVTKMTSSVVNNRYIAHVQKMLQDVQDQEERRALRVLQGVGSYGVGEEQEQVSIFSCFEYLVEHKLFELVICLIIVSNSVMIGAHTDWMAQNYSTNNREPEIYRTLELFFISVFTGEVVIRALAQRLRFFFGKDWRWNYFDLLVVAAALIEELLTQVVTTDMTNIRVLRILRLVRILRVVRITRFFRELRIMVCGIQSSLQSLVWAMVLLFLMMFMFAVYIMQIVTDHVSKEDSDVSSEDNDALKEFYGSLTKTMWTLFLAVTGGSDWGNGADPLITVISPLFALVYAFYIAIVVWALMNVITGVFVDGAIKMAELDTENMVKEDLTARKAHMEHMRKIFDEADREGKGFISWEQLQQVLGNTHVRAYFRRLGMDISEAHGLFELLDLDRNGFVDRNEFVLGFTQLRGQAKSLDLARFRFETMQSVDDLKNDMKGLASLIKIKFANVNQQLLQQQVWLQA